MHSYLCCHGVTSARHLMTNMWEAPEGQRDAFSISGRRASTHSLASVCMRCVGSVIHRDVDGSIGGEGRRSVCAVCTAPCLVELDLISGSRSEPIIGSLSRIIIS
jgi:hypothetical protein